MKSTFSRKKNKEKKRQKNPCTISQYLTLRYGIYLSIMLLLYNTINRVAKAVFTLLRKILFLETGIKIQAIQKGLGDL